MERSQAPSPKITTLAPIPFSHQICMHTLFWSQKGQAQISAYPQRVCFNLHCANLHINNKIHVFPVPQRNTRMITILRTVFYKVNILYLHQAIKQVNKHSADLIASLISLCWGQDPKSLHISSHPGWTTAPKSKSLSIYPHHPSWCFACNT